MKWSTGDQANETDRTEAAVDPGMEDLTGIPYARLIWWNCLSSRFCVASGGFMTVDTLAGRYAAVVKRPLSPREQWPEVNVRVGRKRVFARPHGKIVSVT